MVDITKILLRRDTKANWESNNPILSEGEPVVAFENNQVVAVKIGVDGKHYSELPNILEDKTDLTGFNAATWRLRYVGTSAAAIIHSENICYEEYYAYFVRGNK